MAEQEKTAERSSSIEQNSLINLLKKSSIRTSQSLPVEKVTPTSRRNVFFSCLGVLGLVVFCNFAAKWYLERHTPDRGDWLIREKWERLLGLEKPVDWLVLGDSSCNQGVVPSVLNQTLNTTSINLCTIGNMTNVNNAWMLETYIKKYGPPRNVLIVHVYDVWSRNLTVEMLAKVPLQWRYWEQLSPQIHLNTTTDVKVLVKQQVPFYSSSQNLQTVLKSPLESFNRSQTFRLEDDGLMVWEHSDPINVEEQKTRHLNSVRQKERFQLSSDNRAALNQMIALAEKYNFDIYLANSPIHDGLYQEAEFQAYYNQVRNTLREYAARSPRVHYVLQEPATFPKEQMENSDHLTFSAAKVYTEKLAAEIAALQQQAKTK